MLLANTKWEDLDHCTDGELLCNLDTSLLSWNSHLESLPAAPTSHTEMAQETWEDHCSFPSSEMWVMHLAWPSTPRPSKCRHPGREMPVVSQELRKEMISGKRCSAWHAHLTMNLFCCVQQGPSCPLKPVLLCTPYQAVLEEGNGKTSEKVAMCCHLLLPLSPKPRNSLSFNTTDC